MVADFCNSFPGEHAQSPQVYQRVHSQNGSALPLWSMPSSGFSGASQHRSATPPGHERRNVFPPIDDVKPYDQEWLYLWLMISLHGFSYLNLPFQIFFHATKNRLSLCIWWLWRLPPPVGDGTISLHLDVSVTHQREIIVRET